MLNEYVGNLHSHTVYSDGAGTHEAVARAAIDAGLDFVAVTDHNVWVGGMDGYWHLGDQRVLMLTAEEIHDSGRYPQGDHLLVYEAGEEMAPLAPNTQRLLDAVNEQGGFAVLAHPVDPPAKLFEELDLSWVSWEVEGFGGIEIWNFMSEFKTRLGNWPSALLHAYSPARIASGPFPETMKRWDALLKSGRRIVALGNADAHALPYQKGPFRREIFPYEFLFRTVNTHVLTEQPLIGDMEVDRKLLFDSLRTGLCFVGYDLEQPTRGFRFRAQADSGPVQMGDAVSSRFGITLQIKLPARGMIRLLNCGELVREWENAEAAILAVSDPGAYRVEVLRYRNGAMRGWIYSNPIYLLPGENG